DQPHLNRPVGLPYHQLFLATKGKGIFRIFGAGDFELLPGEAIIILKGTGHEYYPVSKEVWKLGFVGFDGELADTMLSQLNLKEVKKLYVHAHSVIWENIEQLWSVAKKNGSTVQWRTSERIYSLLLELKRLSELDDHIQQNDDDEPPQNKHVRKVAEFIRENYARDLTISYLSSLAGYSAHHFTRIFKSIYNITPHQYMMDIRLEKSKFLLEQNVYLYIS